MSAGALPLITASLFGASAFTLAYGLTGGGRNRVRHRLEAIAGPPEQAAGSEALPTGGGLPFLQRTNARMQDNLHRAGLTWTTRRYLVISLLTGLVFGSLVFVATKVVLVAVLVGLVGSAGPRMIVRRRAAAHDARLNAQVADTIELIASAMRSGFGFMHSLELAGREQSGPISEEFKQVVREIDLGVSVDEALERLAIRTKDEDLELVVQAVLVLRRVGGDLGEVLGRIADMIRDRIRVRGEIRTLTAQMRMSSWIISGLPLALGGVTTLMQPEQMAVLFTEPIGQMLVAVALILQVIGFIVIRRISDITY